MGKSKIAPLHVLGLGPGAENQLTLHAVTVLESVECIAGYTLYLALLPQTLKNRKTLIESGMRHEVERCRRAVECSLQGRSTALVCSGDPGIYAMASLVIEILEKDGLQETVPLEIVPGVPAFCAAAARLGAPLGHDFACISLSDLLTPWEIIEKRVRGALEGDFVCVLYNPKSKGRPDYLAQVLQMARKWRNPDCPIALAKNISRIGETVLHSTLKDFDPQLADMLSLVIMGNDETRFAGKYMLTPRGYHKKNI